MLKSKFMLPLAVLWGALMPVGDSSAQSAIVPVGQGTIGDPLSSGEILENIDIATTPLSNGENMIVAARQIRSRSNPRTRGVELWSSATGIMPLQFQRRFRSGDFQLDAPPGAPNTMASASGPNDSVAFAYLSDGSQEGLYNISVVIVSSDPTEPVSEGAVSDVPYNPSNDLGARPFPSVQVTAGDLNGDGADDVGVFYSEVDQTSGAVISQLQRFDQDGNPVGEPDSLGDLGGLIIDVGPAVDSKFVALTQKATGAGIDISGAIIDVSEGTALVTEFPISEDQFLPQNTNARIAKHPRGNDFTVFWETALPSGPSVMGKSFDGDGTPKSSSRVVGAELPNGKTKPSVTVGPVGEAAVTFTSEADDGILLQLFGPEGEFVGDPVKISPETSAAQDQSVANFLFAPEANPAGDDGELFFGYIENDETLNYSILETPTIERNVVFDDGGFEPPEFGFAVTNAEIKEPDSGETRDMVFTITLNKPAGPGVFRFHAQGLAVPTLAIPTVDFVPEAGLAFIDIGQTTVDVPIAVIGDDAVEPDELFSLVVVPAAPDVEPHEVRATGTIRDNDVDPQGYATLNRPDGLAVLPRSALNPAASSGAAAGTSDDPLIAIAGSGGVWIHNTDGGIVNNTSFASFTNELGVTGALSDAVGPPAPGADTRGSTGTPVFGLFKYSNFSGTLHNGTSGIATSVTGQFTDAVTIGNGMIGVDFSSNQLLKIDYVPASNQYEYGVRLGGGVQGGGSFFTGATESITSVAPIDADTGFVVTADGRLYRYDFSGPSATFLGTVVGDALRVRIDPVNQVGIVSSFDQSAISLFTYDASLTATVGPVIDLGAGNNPVGIDIVGFSNRSYATLTGFDSGRYLNVEIDPTNLASPTFRYTDLPTECINPGHTILFEANELAPNHEFKGIATCNGSDRAIRLEYGLDDLISGNGAP